MKKRTMKTKRKATDQNQRAKLMIDEIARRTEARGAERDSRSLGIKPKPSV